MCLVGVARGQGAGAGVLSLLAAEAGGVKYRVGFASHGSAFEYVDIDLGFTMLLM